MRSSSPSAPRTRSTARRTRCAAGIRSCTSSPWSQRNRRCSQAGPGSHKIEGIGIGFAPPLWRRDEVDAIVGVSTDDANAMARQLAREEAIFAGTSTGANVVAAIELAKRLGVGKTVGTIAVDSGLRYLSTDAYRA